MTIGSHDVAIGFASLKIDGGYTFTLTTRFGGFLHEAEQRFGPRDMTYTPLGIEFHGSQPQLWFPGNRRHVSVILTDAARSDPGEALFELAHETVHLLAPTGSSSAPIFEEGLATLFAHEKSHELGLNKATSDPAYLHCEALVRELLTIRPDAVLAARQLQPSFAAMTPDVIKSVDNRVSDGLATALLEPFPDVVARLRG